MSGVHRFRVLHISDTHFCEVPDRHNLIALYNNPPALSLNYKDKKVSKSIYPGSFDKDIAHGIANFVSDVAAKIDLIVISGDLSTTGRVDDLDVAHGFVSLKPNRTTTFNGRPTIGAHSEKVFIVPGNHDRYKNNIGAPWSASFNLQFGLFWNPQNLDIKHRFVDCGASKICFISVDFCLRESSDAERPVLVNRFGRGKAYKDTIGRLDVLMDTLGKLPEKFIFVWVIHFPPTPNCKSYEKLIDYDLVVDLAHKHGVSLILSGHVHLSSITKSQHGTPIICAGTACAADNSPDCWVHVVDMRIQDNEIDSITKLDYCWSDDDGEFVKSGPAVTI